MCRNLAYIPRILIWLFSLKHGLYNKVWKEKLPELLKLSLIGLIQCSSIATCERCISHLNLINNKFRNRLKSNMVDEFIWISIEEPELEKHDFSANIFLWWERKEYHHIYTKTSHEHHDDIEDFMEDIDWNIVNLIYFVLELYIY